MEPSTTSGEDPQVPGLDPAAVCSLPPDDMAARMAWVRQEILPHAIETVRLGRGLAFELLAAPGLGERLDRLVELERACCSEIVFESMASAVPGRLRLEVRGIDPDAEIFRSLDVPASTGEQPSLRARVAQAAAAGVLGSLILCCVLPVAAVAALGTAAAPLTALDGPVPIALGALVGGTAAWWWLGRRRVAHDAGCGPGC